MCNACLTPATCYLIPYACYLLPAIQGTLCLLPATGYLTPSAAGALPRPCHGAAGPAPTPTCLGQARPRDHEAGRRAKRPAARRHTAARHPRRLAVGLGRVGQPGGALGTVHAPVGTGRALRDPGGRPPASAATATGSPAGAGLGAGRAEEGRVDGRRGSGRPAGALWRQRAASPVGKTGGGGCRPGPARGGSGRVLECLFGGARVCRCAVHVIRVL
jgi:hypothetical protein